MPILLYCVAAADPPVNGLLTGVARVPVLRLKRQALTAFASESATAEVWMTRPLSEASLEFHHVLKELFRSTAIIPFRFPTILANVQELNEHLDERRRDYSSLLERFKSSVQLEALVTDSPATHDERPAVSGTEYLRTKQKRADSLERLVCELQIAAGEAAKQWRTRIIQSGVRCCALVERELVTSVRRAVENVQVPDGFKLRVSGPWPATEFLELSQL